MSCPASIQKDISLKPFAFWKIGGVAEYYLAPTGLEELKEAVAWASKNNIAIRVFSGATNMLINDEKIGGLVIHMSSFQSIEHQIHEGSLKIDCLSGTQKSEVLKVFLKYKLAPALFLTGLPGDIGGGIVMNAGVGEARVPREFCEITQWFEVLKWNSFGDVQTKHFLASEVNWDYRSCSGWQPGIITKVGLSWPLEEDPSIMKSIREATRKRVQSQPLDKPSCGSVFRNPPGGKSAKLIQDCGLKGYSIGGAQVSEKHANFIINTGDASAEDVKTLIKYVHDTVLSETGFDLHEEVIYFGFEDNI